MKSYGTFVINGRFPQEMVVDDQVYPLLLPYKVAAHCNAKPADSAPTVSVETEIGTTVQCKQIELESIQVGEFRAEHVNCLVLPPSIDDAHAVLGSNFLLQYDRSLSRKSLTLLGWRRSKSQIVRGTHRRGQRLSLGHYFDRSLSRLR